MSGLAKRSARRADGLRGLELPGTRLPPPRWGSACAVGDAERSNRDWVLPAVMLLSVLLLLVAVAISSGIQPDSDQQQQWWQGEHVPAHSPIGLVFEAD